MNRHHDDARDLKGATMMEIGVAADDGNVTLTGTVTSRAESLAAEDVACHVAGVHDVTNRILVVPTAPPTPGGHPAARRRRSPRH
jgi:osmotically-inducible protein OsmY